MKNKIIKPKISYTEYFNIREIDYSIDNKEFDQDNIGLCEFD